MRACAACVRRSRLLGELTPDLQRPVSRPPLVLELDLDDQALAVRGRGGRRPVALQVSDDEVLSGAARDERELGVEAVCRCSSDYPRRLLDLPDPPAVLHVRGGVEALRRVLGRGLTGASVAMVGSRRAPAEARRFARDLGEAVSRAGITVVSGMAFGIDEASHEGALAAGPAGREGVGGTIAVLAGGPERPTPARLRPLYDRIGRDGVVVSELPPRTTPRPWSFPARNRIIAALGDALVVVSCARGSGSLRSVEHAWALGRPLGAVPGPVLEPAHAGSNDLLRGTVAHPDHEDDPWTAEAIVEADDVRVLLGGERRIDRKERLFPPGRAGASDVRRFRPRDDVPLRPGAIAREDPLVGLEGDARDLAQRLTTGPRTIESLIAESDAVAVLAGLGELEACGRLRRSLGGDLELVEPPRRGGWDG